MHARGRVGFLPVNTTHLCSSPKCLCQWLFVVCGGLDLCWRNACVSWIAVLGRRCGTLHPDVCAEKLGPQWRCSGKHYAHSHTNTTSKHPPTRTKPCGHASTPTIGHMHACLWACTSPIRRYTHGQLWTPTHTPPTLANKGLSCVSCDRDPLLLRCCCFGCCEALLRRCGCCGLLR